MMGLESVPYENSTIQSGLDVFRKSATNRVPETVGYASNWKTLVVRYDSSLRMRHIRSYGVWSISSTMRIARVCEVVRLARVSPTT